MVLLVITRPQSRSPLVLDTKEKVVRMWLTKVEEVKMLLVIKLEDEVVNDGSGYVNMYSCCRYHFLLSVSTLLILI